MGAQGVVVLPGQGPVWNMSPGRSAVLKLLGGATGGSIMMFEETVPGGTKSTFHLHHDSDEVAYVDRKSTRLNSSHTVISYAVFCLKKKKKNKKITKEDK